MAFVLLIDHSAVNKFTYVTTRAWLIIARKTIRTVVWAYTFALFRNGSSSEIRRSWHLCRIYLHINCELVLKIYTVKNIWTSLLQGRVTEKRNCANFQKKKQKYENGNFSIPDCQHENGWCKYEIILAYYTLVHNYLSQLTGDVLFVLNACACINIIIVPIDENYDWLRICQDYGVVRLQYYYHVCVST